MTVTVLQPELSRCNDHDTVFKVKCFTMFPFVEKFMQTSDEVNDISSHKKILNSFLNTWYSTILHVLGIMPLLQIIPNYLDSTSLINLSEVDITCLIVHG